MAMLGVASARIDLNIDGFQQNARQAEQSMNRLEGSAGRSAGGFGLLKAGVLGVGTVLAPALGIGVMSAVNLEQAIANVNASLGGLPQGQLDALTAEMQRVGTASKFSATEVAGVSDELAKAGYDFEDIVGGKMTQSVVDLSQATGEGLPIATKGITQAMAMWDESIVGADKAMTDATVATDILTNASNESAGGITDVIGGLRNMGPAAASVGLGFDETSAAIAMFTNYGYSGSEAGTKLSRAIQFMAAPTEKSAKLMSELGISAFDAQGEFVGFPALFDNLQTSMAGMSDEARASALKVMFGAEAYDAMMIAVEQGGDPLREMEKLMNQTGSAAEQSALRMDTLGAQFDTLREGVSTFLGSLVEGLLPGFRAIVDGANAFIDVLMGIPGPIKTAMGAVMLLLGGIGALNLAIQGSQAIGALTGISFAGMGASIAAVIPIVAAVAAVAGGLYLAWRTNFLGIRDVVGDVVDTVTGFADAIIDAWDAIGSTTNNPISRFLSSLSSGFRELDFGWADDFADVLSDVSEAIEDFAGAFTDTWDELFEVVVPGGTTMFGDFAVTTERVVNSVNTLSRFLYSLGAAFTAIDLPGVGMLFTTLGATVETLVGTFQEFRDAGLNPVTAALSALAWTFPSLSQVFVPLTEMVRDLTAALTAFMDGDFSAGFDLLGEAAGNAMDAIREIGSLAAGLVVDLANWTINVGIPSVVGAAQSIWNAVSSWVTNTAWPAVSGAAITIGGVLVDIGSWLRNRVPDVFSEVASWFTDVAWPAALGAAQAIGGVLVDIAGWAQGVVRERLWPFVSGWIDTLVATIGDLSREIPGAIINLGRWIRGTAERLWPFISRWIDELIATAGTLTKQIPSVTVQILDWIVTAFKTLQRAIEESVLAEGVSLSDVIVNILSFKPFLNEPIDEAIEDAVGAVAITLARVFVDIVSFEYDLPSMTRVLQAGVFAAVAGIVLAAAPVSVPILIGIGLITMTVLGAFAIARWVANWADENPLDAVDMLIEIAIGLDKITPDVSLPSKRELTDAVLTTMGLPTTGEMEVAIKVVVDFVIDFNWPGTFGDSASSEEAQKAMGNEQITLPLMRVDAEGFVVNEEGLRLVNQATGQPMTPDDLAEIATRDLTGGVTLDIAAGEATVNADKFNFEPVKEGIRTGMESAGPGMFTRPLRTSLATARMALIPDMTTFGMGIGTSLSTALAPLGQVAATGFNQVRTSAGMSLAGVSSTIGLQAATWTPPIRLATTTARTALMTNMLGMRTSTAVNMAGIRTTTALQSAAMRASIASNARQSAIALAGQNAGMALNQLVTWGGIAGTTATNAAAMYTSTATNATQSAIALAGQNAGMALNTTATWATISSTVSSRGAAMAASAGNAARSAASSLASGMASATSAVAGAAGRWPGIIAGAGGAMRSAGFGAGAAGGAGVAAGLRSQLGAVASAANAIISTANSALRAAARIASPSKLTMIVGRQLGAGVQRGIKVTTGDVAREARRSIEAVDRSMQQAIRRTTIPDLPAPVSLDMRGVDRLIRGGLWRESYGLRDRRYGDLGTTIGKNIRKELTPDVGREIGEEIRRSTERFTKGTQYAATQQDAAIRTMQRMPGLTGNAAIDRIASQLDSTARRALKYALEHDIPGWGNLTEQLTGPMEQTGRNVWNRIAGTEAERFKVLAQYFDHMVDDGEYMSDAIAHVSRDLRNKVIPLGKQLSPLIEGYRTREQMRRNPTYDRPTPQRGNTYIDNRQYFALKSEEYVEMQRNAEEGAQGARSVAGLSRARSTQTVRRGGAL